MRQVILDWWPLLMSAAHVAAASGVTIDAVLRKRQSASVIGWVGLAWLAPMIGSIAYLLLGINRIHRKGSALRLRAAWHQEQSILPVPPETRLNDSLLAARHPSSIGLARLGRQLTGNPLLPGNGVELLENGDAAFPAMLAAIEGAQRSVTLLTYIFDNDQAGVAFRDALLRAHRRGVAVRVLIDDMGSHYTRPTMVHQLRQSGVPVAAFLEARASRFLRYANLRNHRKILVTDGAVGFIGGLNVREGHWLSLQPTDPVPCLHFKVTGPIVSELQRTFAIDWAFTTGEQLFGKRWLPENALCGPVAARGVPNGPDEDLDNMEAMLLGAIAVATDRLRIVTPYFLPDDALLRALMVAAMRGVAVDIVLPAKSNLPIMDWAVVPQLQYLLEKGCRVFFTPPPFDHTKLLIIDGYWSFIGSINWDVRSLRLNFEYNVECYCEALAGRLDRFVDTRITSARALALKDLHALPFWARVRNGLARLLSPYL